MDLEQNSWLNRLAMKGGMGSIPFCSELVAGRTSSLWSKVLTSKR